MKRKGFTLVELLAVIVILSVIGLITIPIIGNIIEDSKKKALEQSVKGLVEAANYFAISNDGDYHFIFSNEEKGISTTGENLSYKGIVDATGDLYIDNEENISLCLMNENYYIYKNYNSGIYIGNVAEDTCIAGYDALTNKYVAMLDDGTGEVSNVYSKEQVDSKIAELNTTLNSYALKADLDSLTTLVNNNTASVEKLKNDLNGNLNMRYNEERDMVEIYYNGEWHQWKLGNIQGTILFNGNTNEGLVNDNITGGFSVLANHYGSSVEITNSQISLIGVGNDTSGTIQPRIRSVNSIDLTNYNKLIIECTSNFTGGSYIGFTKDQTTYAYNGDAYIRPEIGINEIDISLLNGYYYLQIHGGTGTGVNGKYNINYILLQ